MQEEYRWAWIPAAVAVALIALWAYLAVSVRRLHDLGHSAWMTALLLVPLVNTLTALWMGVQEGQDSPNKYGPAPTSSPSKPNVPKQAQHRAILTIQRKFGDDGCITKEDYNVIQQHGGRWTGALLEEANKTWEMHRGMSSCTCRM